MISTFSKSLSVRNLIYDAIVAEQTSLSSRLTYTGFHIAKSYVPFSEAAETATREGRLWIVPSHFTDHDRKTREGIDPLITRQLCCQVAYQQSDVQPDDLATLDNLVLLIEQLMDLVRCTKYSLPEKNFNAIWTTNEPLKDDNGVPLSFYMLREGTIFESYFYAYFSTTHQ